jgi:hypothetical protein
MQKNLSNEPIEPIDKVQEAIDYLADILVDGFLSQYEQSNNEPKESSNILPSVDKGTSRGRK